LINQRIEIGRFTFREPAKTRSNPIFGSSAGPLWSGFDPWKSAFYILVRRRLQPCIRCSRSVVLAQHFGDNFRFNLLGLHEQAIGLLVVADRLFMQALFR
jgi:hypothetical protein